MMHHDAKKTNKPLVYSCSGCSNVAQLANDLAMTLNSMGIAEMSCISGVGGNVRPLVKLAKSGRIIIALDGCPLNCVKACLGQHEVQATHHFELSSILPIRKKPNQKCTKEELSSAFQLISSKLASTI
jgi:uncharacterized metal-binding protein